MSPKVCEEGKIFNPKTNRCISDTPVNRKKIEELQTNKSKSKSITPINNIPPMGPIIHPEYIYDIKDTLDNIKEFKIIKKNNLILFNYIYAKRFNELLKSNTNISFSEMEIDDLLKLGKDIKEYLYNGEFITKEKYEKAIKLDNKIRNIVKKNTITIIHDLPVEKYVGTNKIYSSRYEIRKLVKSRYDRVRRDLNVIKNTLESRDFGNEVINYTHIKSVLRDKEYIDELIKLGIFSFDDLWNNVFKDPFIYDKLLITYRKYLELHKELEDEKKKQTGGKKKKKQ